MKHKDFFEQVSKKYGDIIKARGSKEELGQWIKPRMGPKVLDIGCGGVRDFVSPNTQQYIGFDFSLSMLKKGDPSIQKICGNALTPPFKKEIFDTLFYRSLLHHLTGKKIKETEGQVKHALMEGWNLLKENGNLMVVEPCISRWLEKIERIFYFFVKIFCTLTKQPEILIFSSDRLKEILMECGYNNISILQVREGRKKWRLVSPIIGLPRLKIPLGLLPVCQVVLEAKKGAKQAS